MLKVNRQTITRSLLLYEGALYPYLQAECTVDSDSRQTLLFASTALWDAISQDDQTKGNAEKSIDESIYAYIEDDAFEMTDRRLKQYIEKHLD